MKSFGYCLLNLQPTALTDNQVTCVLKKRGWFFFKIGMNDNVFCEDEQTAACQEKYLNPTIGSHRFHIFSWLLATVWRLRNDKQNVQEQQKRHNLNKVSPSASVMNFFPQWYVSCSNSLQVFDCTTHQNWAGSYGCLQNTVCVSRTLFSKGLLYFKKKKTNFSDRHVSPSKLFLISVGAKTVAKNNI